MTTDTWIVLVLAVILFSVLGIAAIRGGYRIGIAYRSDKKSFSALLSREPAPPEGDNGIPPLDSHHADGSPVYAKPPQPHIGLPTTQMRAIGTADQAIN